MDETFNFGEDLPYDFGEICQERWDRAREEIDFRDLAQELLVKDGLWHRKGNAISCPFHGGAHGESTPSFNFYPASNSAFCFGCPPPKQNQCYDPISFVARYFGMTNSQALVWLEHKFQLPLLQAASVDKYLLVDENGQVISEESEEEEDTGISYSCEDVSKLYIRVAPSLIKSVADAQDLLKTYFIATLDENPLPLARVLGKDRLAKFLR